MITINLNTKVENTREFKRLLRMKTIEGFMRFVKEAFKENKIKVDAEVIPQTGDYEKDAKLLIKNIRFTNEKN